MTSHAERITRENAPPLDKEALAKQIIDNGQFLIGEQPKVVRNGLSTDLLVFPSDIHPSRRGLLHEKVNAAIEYAASFNDIERLNALQYLPGPYDEQEDSHGRRYLTLGLYLYFADECSRKNPGMTFLTALREADARLPGDQAIIHEDTLLKKTKLALELAGINSQKNLDILDQWASQKNYTIGGELHQSTGNENVSGAYAELAKKLVEKYRHLHLRGAIVGLNEAISYALGNKDHMRQRQDDEDAYQHVRETVNNPENIQTHVREGCRVRHKRIMEIINQQDDPVFSNQEIHASLERQEEARSIVNQILKFYPKEALELMLRERQTTVYSDRETIAGVFPAGDIPGQRKKLTDASRDSIGVRMQRYGVSFFSNGKHRDADRVDEETKYMRVAQSGLHELMHIAYGMMTEDEKKHLEDLATRVSIELQNGNTEDKIYATGTRPKYERLSENNRAIEHTHLLEDWSLPEVMDYRSALYNGYRYDPKMPNTYDSRREEVICNTFGMIHTEFKDRVDPKNLLWNNPQGLEAMREFAQAVDDTFKAVVERVRREKDIPRLSQGHVRT